MVVFIAGMVTVSSAERQTMWGRFCWTAATNFSGATSTPRSVTSKPPPSSIEDTRFLPMSCKSPFTVPITTRPVGCVPVSASNGRSRKQQFRHEVLLTFVPTTHFGHRGNHGLGNQDSGIHFLRNGRLSDGHSCLGISVQNRIMKLLQISHKIL